MTADYGWTLCCLLASVALRQSAFKLAQGNLRRA